MDDVVKAISILKNYIDELESRDPQFLAIKKVMELRGLASLGVVIGNALVSYRLKGTGEEYWTEFGEFFIHHEPTFENLVKFILMSKFNVALKEQKVKRLKKVRPLLEEISKEPEKFSDLDYLLGSLRKVLKAKGTEKTLVFAAKMAYYAFKALGVETRGDAPIPIDSRIATVTCASGLIEGSVEEIMGVKRDAAIEAWREVAKRAGVKTLHLDALVWLPARGLRRALCKSLEKGREVFEKNLRELGVRESVGVTYLLIKRRCC